MSQSDPRELHTRLLALLQEAELEPRLCGEMARARREFFGADAVSRQDPAGQAAAATRFAEWYLLERESDQLGGVPHAVLLGSEELAESLVGIFWIDAVVGDEARARDLQDGQGLDLVGLEPGSLEPGTLLLGRVFQTRAGGFVPSIAAIAIRDAGPLAQAIERDLAALDLGRRMTQAEMEHLLLSRGLTPGDPPEVIVSIERIEAELETCLAVAGMPAQSVTQISAALREAPTPGLVIGPLLDQLAFDTGADLDTLRRLLMELWSAHHQPGRAPLPPAPRAPAADLGPGLGSELAARIERGLETHEDPSALFADVERMLGESGIETEADEEPGVTFGSGDLEPLVTEYLWEAGLAGTPEAQVLLALVRQQRELPVPSLDLEYLQTDDLLRLLLHVFVSEPAPRRAEAVHDAFLTLQQFYAWAETAQGFELGATLQGVESAFVVHVDRLAAASHVLGDATTPQVKPQLWQVVGVAADRLEVSPHDEDSRFTVTAAAGATRWLQIGDLLLGALEHRAGTYRFVGTVVALPQTAEPLLG